MFCALAAIIYALFSQFFGGSEVVHLVVLACVLRATSKKIVNFLRKQCTFPEKILNLGYTSEFAHFWKKILRAPLFVLDHPIVNSYFRYQSSTRLLDKKTRPSKQVDLHSPTGPSPIVCVFYPEAVSILSRYSRSDHKRTNNKMQIYQVIETVYGTVSQHSRRFMMELDGRRRS